MLEKLFEITNSIADVIAQKNDYNEMLPEIVRIVATGLNASVCSVYVYDKESDELTLNATYGLNSEAIRKIKMKSGEGLTGTCFLENSLLNIKEPEKHPNFKFFPDSGEEAYHSFLAIPLNIANKCLGVLVIQSCQSDIFPDNIVNMAKSIGTQIANLLMNSDILNILAEQSQTKDKDQNQNPEEPSEIIRITGSPGNIGIALGTAYIFDASNPFMHINYSETNSADSELEILDNAIKLAIEKTVALEKKALSLISEADASIFHAHLLFLEDKTLIKRIKESIISHSYSAEYALKTVYDDYTKLFLSLKEESFRDKTMDFKDVMLRLLETILMYKQMSLSHIDYEQIEKKNVIVIAKEILPSDLLKFPTENIKGIICEKGGVNAHVSILAKALNIPALMSAKKATSLANDNDNILLDSYGEVAYVNPPEFIMERYYNILLSKLNDEPYLENISSDALTANGSKIYLRANVGLVNETVLLKKYGAEGIGLYRTEFLYMIRDRLPSEEEQYDIFSKIFKYANGHEVTIRTLDAGSDKPLPYMEYQKEENPALGLRGSRFLLSKPHILKPHLRAILRSGSHGSLNIMFPMISTCDEILKLKAILKDIEQELTDSNIEHSKNYKLGIMIEVPSVIMDLKSIIKEVDFLSVGSNDLFQYLFASDRTNDDIQSADLVLHPSFLRLIKIIGDDCKANNYKKVSVCGDIACKPIFIPLIIGCGIHELSMPPRFIPTAKETVRHFSTDECISILGKCIDLNNERGVLEFLQNIFAEKGISHLIEKKHSLYEWQT